MSREEIYKKLNIIFEETLELDDINLTDETTADDVDGWDSLAHITLINEIEENFKIKIPMKSIIYLKNVGELVDVISKQINN